MIVLYICKNVYVMNTKATIEVDLSLFEQLKRYAAYSGGYPFSISGDIRSVPS